MSSAIIQVSNLGKCYTISGAQSGYKTIRETLSDAVKKPFELAARSLRQGQTGRSNPDHVIWAVRNVTFEVEPGEVIGVIGRNGAGKSTLLKMLSRITEPTEGSIDLYGRVGSLLEVGTGFHPELSGRENIYLNGAVLGMHRNEIDRKLDEIIEFAEIGQFIDTPVKRYSSGMYLRLAFSVAAHLEPDILLVDEVLAVGDIVFQQKCLNHMRDLTRQGMTILLVSHNLAAIQSSCRRTLLMKDGSLYADGNTLDVIETYRQSVQKDGEDFGLDETGSRSADQPVSILGFRMYGEEGKPTREIRFGEPVRVEIDLEAGERIERPMINFGIRRGDGTVVCNFNNWYDNFEIEAIEGRCRLTGWLPPLRLVPDFYEIHVLVWPWGGGHLQGDMTRQSPYAWKTFGSFRIYGVGLNAHDGVYQVPAQKWAFTNGSAPVEFTDITDNSIHEAFHS